MSIFIICPCGHVIESRKGDEHGPIVRMLEHRQACRPLRTVVWE